jgi:hypothetical protein
MIAPQRATNASSITLRPVKCEGDIKNDAIGPGHVIALVLLIEILNRRSTD